MGCWVSFSSVDVSKETQLLAQEYCAAADPVLQLVGTALARAHQLPVCSSGSVRSALAKFTAPPLWGAPPSVTAPCSCRAALSGLIATGHAQVGDGLAAAPGRR